MSTFTVILTAFRADNDLLTNCQRNLELYKEALSLGLLHVASGIGSYQEEGQEKPSQEASMMFTTTSAVKARELMLSACTRFAQDCCLLLQGLDGYLVSWDGDYLQHNAIGKWQEVSKEEAKQSVAYTWINGRYFLCK